MRPKIVNKKQDRGAALVLALLIVAMVTAISVEVSWRFDLGATRSGNRWYGMQAEAYLEGAEALAKIFLRQDMQDSKYDTLGEDWAQPSPPFPTDEGWVQGVIEDAAGRFNLNLMSVSVTPKPNSTTAQRFSESQRRFIRLLQTIPLEADVYLDEQTAISIAEAVIDWIDPDSNVTGFGGAESDYYDSLEIPFTIANKMMVSVSELRIIRGLNELPQTFLDQLMALVIALPPDSKLNVNTALPQVLQSLNGQNVLTPLTLEEVQEMLLDRGEELKGFENLGDFQSSHGVTTAIGTTKGSSGGGLDPSDLVVNSNYFIFKGETQVGDRIRRSRSILKREGDDVVTLRRSDGNF